MKRLATGDWRDEYDAHIPRLFNPGILRDINNIVINQRTTSRFCEDGDKVRFWIHFTNRNRSTTGIHQVINNDETFAVAFARLEQLRDPARFGPWVAMVARRNRPSAWIGESQWDEAADVPWPGASPESTAEAVAALQAIRRLPEAYRETLILRLVEGMSGPEIAVLTGLTPQSVRVNLHRGMVKLRLALGIAVEPEENADDRQA